MSSSVEMPAEVVEYIAAVPAHHREVFDRLHSLVLETLSEARVVLSYSMPTYVTPRGRVSLSAGKAGVSIATTVAEPVAEFSARHPELKAGKVTVLFPPDQDLPVDDLRALILAAGGAR